ncbi:MAG: DUF3570 domain-containing protein [Pseudomonadales bacterium]|nr:DUF3570 domain-containing protein [Pseudomonadales bacterium]
MTVLRTRTQRLWRISLLTLMFAASQSGAAVLPEDRIDLLYHSFDGGGADISGPSVLVRKGFADKLSVTANYYVDMVSSASIDVQATASPYREERTEMSLGVEYLNDKTVVAMSATQSEENDYDARTMGLSLSQSFFGDLTTVSMSASVGQDTVRRNGDDGFEDQVDRKRFGVSLSQIITGDLIIAANAELVTDEGYLNNPYRSVRFADPAAGSGFAWQGEVYPRTRNSDAVSVRGIYYLPWRASFRTEYRFFSDSWDIRAHNLEIRYVHPVDDALTFEFSARRYQQTAASFYQDLFPYRDAQTFMARDKELSAFNSSSLGFGASWELPRFWQAVDRSTINIFYDRMQFRYDNFRDATAGGAAGSEPAYGFDASVLRVFLSVWY